MGALPFWNFWRDGPNWLWPWQHHHKLIKLCCLHSHLACPCAHEWRWHVIAMRGCFKVSKVVACHHDMKSYFFPSETKSMPSSSLPLTDQGISNPWWTSSANFLLHASFHWLALNWDTVHIAQNYLVSIAWGEHWVAAELRSRRCEQQTVVSWVCCSLSRQQRLTD